MAISKSQYYNVTWHQCPQAVRNYLANVTYDPSDYSTSQITNYAPATAVVSNTKPIGETVDGITYYNQVPNTQTPFASTNVAGTLKPKDYLRWLNTVTSNVRDLGGWACDGGTVKYGMLARGGNPSADDRDLLANQVGIRAELNLLGGATGPSILGEDIVFCGPALYNWYSLLDTNGSDATWKTVLAFVFECTKYRRPIFFHCAAGADRTGTLAYILETLLGMSQSDCDKDYELTSFAMDSNSYRMRNIAGTIPQLVSQINALSGSSFQHKVINWIGSLGFTESDVNTFRRNCIDGNPADVHFESQVINLVTTYENNTRFRSSGATAESTGLFIVSNYIQRTYRNHVYRVKIAGATAADYAAMLSNTYLYFMMYKSEDGGQTFTLWNAWTKVGNGTDSWDVVDDPSGAYMVGKISANSVFNYAVVSEGGSSQWWNYFRIGLAGDGANCIITCNQPFSPTNYLDMNRTAITLSSAVNVYSDSTYWDESKLYKNVLWSTGDRSGSVCTIADLTDTSITVTEPGVGGVCACFPVQLMGGKTYTLTYTYSGTGKVRTYYALNVDGTVSSYSLQSDSTAGLSGTAAYTIAVPSGTVVWGFFCLTSNTGGTKSYTNVSLT